VEGSKKESGLSRPKYIPAITVRRVQPTLLEATEFERQLDGLLTALIEDELKRRAPTPCKQPD
jgi:hypothetical protein